jgi:hypothetical protein
LNVTAVNDTPEGTDYLVSMNEDSTYNFSASNFGFTDIDAGASLSGVRIDTLPVDGTLTLNGVAVTAGQIISTAQIGNLAYTPPAFANGLAFASFTFSVRDNANAFDTAPNIITIDVDGVNNAPTSADGTMTMPEDTVHTFSSADFTFIDVDVGDAMTAIRIDSLPINGVLRMNGMAVTAGQVVLMADLPNLTYAPAPDAYGAAYGVFTFSVRDGSNDFSATPNTMTINVVDMFDAPDITPDNLTETQTPVPETVPTQIVIDRGNFDAAFTRTLYSEAPSDYTMVTIITDQQQQMPDAPPPVVTPVTLDTSRFPPSTMFVSGVANTLDLTATLFDAMPDATGYTMRLADGSPLPAWLNFDASTMTLVGTPPEGAGDQLSVLLIITDASGKEIIVPLNLSIVENPDAKVQPKGEPQAFGPTPFSKQLAAVSEAGQRAKIDAQAKLLTR